MSRLSWDAYYMQLAKVIAERSTCDRKHVGCVMVVDNCVVATGYNGSVRSMPHCDDVGHLMNNGHCIRTIHAETNAIAQAARRGVKLDGATCYVTTLPCFNCFKILIATGIKRIVYEEFYRGEKLWPLYVEICERLNIQMQHLVCQPSSREMLEIPRGDWP